MYDPVLNRPMFQGPSSTAQGSSTPSAKGTGITSMVTAPDQGAQQLKTFSTQIAPTIRGFAEGGYLSDSSSTMQGQNPLQSSISQAIDQSLYQQPQGYAGGGVASMWDNFVNSLTIKEPNRSGNYRLPDVGLRISQQSDYRKDAGITGGGANYVEPIDVGGRDAQISPEVYDRVISPTPEERRAEAKRNIDSYEAPPPNASPIGRAFQRFMGQDEAGVAQSRNQAKEVSDAALAREEALRKREALRAQYEEAVNRNPTSVSDYFGNMSDDELAQKQAQRRQAEEAVLKKARPEDFVASGDSNPMNLGGQGLASLPPMPGPGIKTDTTVNPGVASGGAGGGSIATQLAQIKAERNAQSAADRRENALMALMSAGFGMAAGKSRHALQNIAEGGQQGIASFAALERARREDENRRYLAALHERELLAKEPYMQAQTEQAQAQAAYLRARPGIEQAKLSEAARRADSRARLQAEKDVYAHMDKNPAAYLGANGKPDQMKIDAEIALRKKNIEPNILYDMLNGGRQTDNSSGE